MVFHFFVIFLKSNLVDFLKDFKIFVFYLIFINFCLLKFCLSLFLEGDDDQGNENVDEEERKHNEVNNVKNRHLDPETDR